MYKSFILDLRMVFNLFYYLRILSLFFFYIRDERFTVKDDIS